MVLVDSCPEREILARLMRGEFEGPVGERLAQHLEACPRCTGLVASLMLRDPLADAARAPSISADDTEAAAVQRLLNRLRSLQPRPAPAGPTASGETAPTEGLLRSAGLVPYDFLAPPAGPGELGRLGRYRVVKLLGAGGMGIVFQAEDPLLKRTVALKVLRPEAAGRETARARFLREAQAAAALEHENIVTIYEVHDDPTVPHLTMPCLAGISLEARLQRCGTLNPAQVLRLGKQTARGLAAAHARGLVHRDIKPANLWLEPEHGGRIKILDFGLARPIEDEAHLTRRGVLLGTPAYMSPEQARGEPVDPRSDLFSLGVVLYRLCTGKLPFLGDSVMAILTALATHTPRPVREVAPGVPQALSELVMQLLAREPAARPRSAAEVADLLQALERGVITEPAFRTPSVPPPLPPLLPDTALTPPLRRGRRWQLIAGALVLLALVPLTWAVVHSVRSRGRLVIEVNDPDVQVTVKEKGAVLQDRPGQRVLTLPAGEHDVEVTLTDVTGKARSFTSKVTLDRGGTVTLDAAAELARANPPDADRRAAEFVLSLDGWVMLEGETHWIKDVKDLPAAPFHVALIDLYIRTKVDDSTLTHFKGLTHLVNLALGFDRITDTGLAALKGLPNLEQLNLQYTGVTDGGLRHLKELPRLQGLYLDGTQVSEAGLEQLKTFPRLERLQVSLPLTDGLLALLKGMPRLKTLGLSRQPDESFLTHLDAFPQLVGIELGDLPLSDEALSRLDVLPNLTLINIYKAPVGDVGVERLSKLKAWPHLQVLTLRDTRITDKCLVHLQGMLKLQHLNLASTRITDAVVPRLLALPRLYSIDIRGTRVSAKGSAALQTAFPNAAIIWSEPNRAAADAVLAMGGSVTVRVKGTAAQRVVQAAELPIEYFQLIGVNLAGVDKSLDRVLPFLAVLKDAEFDSLETLDLSRTACTDADLVYLDGLPALAELSLAHTRVSDGAVIRLTGLSALSRLNLDGATIHGFGLRSLQQLANLTELRLGCPTLTDKSMLELADLKKLQHLSLAGSKVSDDGLKQLAALTALRELDLSATPVTAAGAADVAKALPKCKIIRR